MLSECHQHQYIETKGLPILLKMENFLESEPIRVENRVSVFSEYDDYIANYDHISSIHLRTLDETGTNPFMGDRAVEIAERETTNLVKKYHPKNGIICDAGVGSGNLLNSLEMPHMIGVDVSMEYLQRLPENIIPILSKLEELPFKSGSIDTIVSTDVLEHVLDLHGAISRIASALKVGGHFIIRVPFEEDLEPYIGVEDFDLVHVRNFTKRGLQVLLEKVYGFELMETVFSNSIYRGINQVDFAKLLQDTDVEELFQRCPEQFRSESFEELLRKPMIELVSVFGAMHSSENPNCAKFLEYISKPVEINVVFKKTKKSKYLKPKNSEVRQIVSAENFSLEAIRKMAVVEKQLNNFERKSMAHSDATEKDLLELKAQLSNIQFQMDNQLQAINSNFQSTAKNLIKKLLRYN